MSINTRSAIAFPIALLAVLAILTAWINYTVQPPTPKLDGSGRHDPDYIVSNFVTTQTDINGSLRYKLAAAEMKHFPDNDATDLINPRYTQYTSGKPYTQVEGLHGQVSSNGERVQLTKQVKVTRQAFADKGEMTVETEYLDILPNQDLVKTDKPVVIRQAPKTVINAVGMIYEKNKYTVTLLHKVKAHYEKPLSNNIIHPKKVSTQKPLADKLTLVTPSKAIVKLRPLKNPKTTKNSKSTIKKPIIKKPKVTRTKDTRIRRRYD